jgi:hypothetical protein
MFVTSIKDRERRVEDKRKSISGFKDKFYLEPINENIKKSAFNPFDPAWHLVDAIQNEK